jgi:PAS domain S-box-containing protein
MKDIKLPNELYKNLVKEAPISIFFTDFDGKVLDYNDGFCKFFGYDEEELIDKSVLDLYPPERKEERKKCIKIIREKGEYRTDTRIYKKDGSLTDIALYFQRIDHEEKPRAVVGYAIDISKRVKANKNLETYAEKLKETNSMKDLFIDIMHHDILSPAGIVRSYIEILKEGKDEDIQIHLQSAYNSINRVIDIVNATNEFSKIKSGEDLFMEELDLKTIIYTAIKNSENIVKESGIIVENRVKKRMPINANPIVESIFTNLISNALKYAPNGKRIVVEAEELDGFYKTMIKDFGPGVPDKDKEAIFNRFKRTHKGAVKGTGLGLAIVKGIAETHGGKAEVRDNPEGGSIFCIYLPKEH